MGSVGRRVTSNRSPILYGALAATLVLVWLAMFLLGTGDVDRAILNALYAGDRPGVANAARLITLLGGWNVVTALAVLAALAVALRGKAEMGLVLFIGTLIGRLLVDLQKYELGRLRPDQHPHLVNVHNLSFPSGHSANAMMTYWAVAVLLVTDRQKRRWWTLAASIIALAVGLSRVMLGVHWPSDVVAGWSFGLLWALILVWIAERVPKAGRGKGSVQ